MLKCFSLFFLVVTYSTVALSQYDNPKRKRSEFGSRDGRFETSVVLAYQNSISEDSEGGSSLDVKSNVGWGFSIGWNWTEKLNFQYRLTSNSPKYLAVLVPEDPDILQQEIERKLSKLSHRLNATYHFFDGGLTPFVSGGIGYTTVDSNFPKGPPQIGCWWDPWWGYICVGEYRTFSTSEFTYNIGVGARWDINNMIFSRAEFNREFISLDNGTLDFDTFTLEFGLMF
jgi:opacity protein-like surface antigen